MYIYFKEAVIFYRKWKPPVKSSHAKCRTSIECLPELIHACEGKDHVFSSMVEKELQPAKTKQVYPVPLHIKCLPRTRPFQQWDHKKKIGNSKEFLNI